MSKLATIGVTKTDTKKPTLATLRKLLKFVDDNLEHYPENSELVFFGEGFVQLNTVRTLGISGISNE